jgi:hypothetical protein
MPPGASFFLLSRSQSVSLMTKHCGDLLRSLVTGCRPVLVAAALSACWMAFAGRSRAECGDYVMIGSSPGPHASQPGPSRLGSGALPFRAPDRQMPCRGPFCSQRAPVPSPVPATVTFVDSQLWALLPAEEYAHPQPVWHGSREESPLEPSASLKSIYHPPRLLAQRSSV